MARPAIAFEELKARLEARLNYMGIKVYRGVYSIGERAKRPSGSLGAGERWESHATLAHTTAANFDQVC